MIIFLRTETFLQESHGCTETVCNGFEENEK